MNASVPFSVSGQLQGFAESEGIISTDGEMVTFEFRTKDSVVGVIASEIKNVTVPVAKIAEASFRKGFFGCSIYLRCSEMKAFSEVPSAEAGEVKLSIAKKHSQAATDFVAAIKPAR